MKHWHIAFTQIHGITAFYDHHDLCQYPHTTVNVVGLHRGDLNQQKY